ncbi:MAG: WD40 repeat domain-containing protein [Neisseriaceae bacterium]|nr:MAG: WD40 repeat domain-containing protein [Neisseriaceae bacterium]
MKHSSPISGVSANKNYIATAGYDNKVILWDRTTFEPIAQGIHDHLVNQCEFSSCGEYLVTSSSDYSCRLWNLPDMRLIKVFAFHDDDVEFATFDPNGKYIATASRDNTIIINSIENDYTKTLIGHSDDVLSVVFSGEDLISCSDDGTIRKWNIFTGVNEILTKSDFQTDTVAIGMEKIFAGDDEGIIYVISGNETNQFKAHLAGIKRLYFCNHSKMLVSMSYDRQCILWMSIGNKIEEIHRFNLPNLIWPRSCTVYGDYIYFATFGSSFGSYNYVTQTWSLDHIQPTHGINAISIYHDSIYRIGDSGQLKKDSSIVYENNSLSNFIINFEDKILIGGQNGQLVNSTDDDLVYEYKSPLNAAVISKQKLYVGTYTGDLLVFMSTSSKPQIFNVHNNAIKDLVSINDEYIITVCANGEICRFDINSGELKIILGHSNIINSCAVVTNNTFVTASRDRKIKLWDVGAMSCIRDIDTFHTHSIKSLSVSPDGRYIASGSYNGTLYILDYKQNVWLKKRITNSGISCIKYDDCSNQFVAGSYDGNIYYIPVPKSN